MRADMFKVIVERPRHGRAWAAHQTRGRLAEDGDLPVKIGLNRHRALTGQSTKTLNENLKPLKRFLQKQLGRPWNKVFSEIAATLAPGHTVKEHVRQHIRDFVARIAIGRNGEWLEGTRTFGDRTRWYQPFYVDPNDGILKDSEKYWKKRGAELRWRWKKPEAPKDVRKLDSNRELRQIDGVWYEVGYRRDPDARPETRVTDLVTRERVSAYSRHAASKRQLSRAELDSHGLINDIND